MKLRDLQASFAGGEVSPALWGRTDIQKYKTALRTCRNFLVMPQGGVRNRPGTAYIATAKQAAAVRMVPFIVSTTQAYMLELGAGYMRFYTADAQILASSTVTAWATSTYYEPGDFVTSGGITYICIKEHKSGNSFSTQTLDQFGHAVTVFVAQTAYEIATPWNSGDNFNLKFTQSNNQMFFALGNQTPYVLTQVASDNWTLVPYTFSDGPFRLQNTDQAKTITPSAVKGALSGSPTNLTSITVDQAGRLILVSSAAMTGLTNGSFVQLAGLTGSFAAFNGVTYSIYFPAPGNGLGQNTTFYLTVAGAPVKTFVYTTIAIGTTLASTGTWDSFGTVTLTASVPTFNANHVGALFQLQRTVVSQTVTQSLTAANQQMSSIQCGPTYSIITTGGWTGIIAVQVSTDNGVTWTTIQTLQSATGGQNYNLSGNTGFSQCLLRVVTQGTSGFNPANAPTWASTVQVLLTSNSFTWTGVGVVITYTSTTSVKVLVTNSSGFADTNSTYLWSEGAWSTYRGFPACTAFFQDRLHWASTKTDPLTGWASETGVYTEFGVSSPAVASDAFSFVLQSRELNAISTMVVMPQLMVVLTSDSEWGIGPGQNGVYSATSFIQQLMGHRGSSSIDPAVVGVEMILVQQMGTVVRNLIFQLAVQGFMGDNISVASQHLFTGYSITQMAYQQEPDSIIWAVRSDGTLLSCTYMRDQELNAWARHDTLNGSFESVAVIPNSTLGINEVWLSVNRGGTRFIEVLKPRDQGTTPSSQWFLDCATQYSGAAVGTVSGIPLANGTAVAILADGNMVANPNRPTSGAGALPAVTVQSGQVTLPAGITASVITVGLPITADISLLDIETPHYSGNQMGVLQGKRVKQPRAKLRVWNSLGGFVGVGEPSATTGITGLDMLSDIMLRDPATNYDTAMPLVTGIVDAVLPAGYMYGSHIFFRQPDPFPFSLLDILGTVVPGGE